MRTGLLVVLLLMPACSSRYMTEDQDKQMKEVCEQPGGCTILPTPVFKRLIEMLERVIS